MTVKELIHQARRDLRTNLAARREIENEYERRHFPTIESIIRDLGELSERAADPETDRQTVIDELEALLRRLGPTPGSLGLPAYTTLGSARSRLDYGESFA